MSCVIQAIQTAREDFSTTHLSVKVYTTVGVVSAVAFAILLATSQKPYAFGTGGLALSALPAAYLINRFEKGQRLDDEKASNGEGEDLQETVRAIQAKIDAQEASFAEIAQLKERMAQMEEVGVATGGGVEVVDAGEAEGSEAERAPPYKDEMLYEYGMNSMSHHEQTAEELRGYIAKFKSVLGW